MALNGQKSKKIDPKKEMIPSKKPKTLRIDIYFVGVL